MTISELINKATMHDLDAMLELAEAYYWGRDIAEDNEKAFSLYRELESLKPNDSLVLYRLGKCYTNGFGIQANPAVGISYYEKAAKNGSADACHNLGQLYKSGDKIPRNLPLAISWFEKAVNWGSDDAMVMLGDMYHTGEGVPKDETAACKLYEMAVNKNNTNACYRLGMQTYNGWGVSENRQLGIDLWAKGAELGHWGCQYLLGSSYLDGIDVPKDIARALEWLGKSADQGLDDAQLLLGRLYLLGLDGVLADEDKGVNYLSAAANAGKVEAMLLLGDYYIKRENSAKVAEAAKWYEMAAERDVFYAVHLAALANNILALSGSTSFRRKNNYYEFSKADWEKVIQLTQKEISMINSGHPDVQPGDLEKAMAQLNKAKYELAICHHEMGNYSMVNSLLDSNTSPEAQLLYAVSLGRNANEAEYPHVLRLLINVFDKQKFVGERSYEEQKYYALAANLISGGYCCGVPGVVKQDTSIAVRILNDAKQQLKEQTWIEYIDKELSHYKPKMFGGYKYV